jgi:hypothetical protein
VSSLVAEEFSGGSALFLGAEPANPLADCGVCGDEVFCRASGATEVDGLNWSAEAVKTGAEPVSAASNADWLMAIESVPLEEDNATSLTSGACGGFDVDDPGWRVTGATGETGKDAALPIGEFGAPGLDTNSGGPITIIHLHKIACQFKSNYIQNFALCNDYLTLFRISFTRL